MRNHSVLPVVMSLVLCSLVACSQQPNEMRPAANAQPDEVKARDKSQVDSGPASSLAQTAAEEEFDYGDWLRLPEGVDRKYRDVYPTLVKSAIAGDSSGQVNLAIASQQLASELAQAGNTDEAYRFIAQSGRALRAGLKDGANQLPAAAIANVFFNEACALSRAEQVNEARAALNDAVEYGFSNLPAVANDDDLVALRESQGFAEQMEVWRTAIAERFRAEALHDLAAGESFPFQLTGTDITGAEINLAALAGKVVIVDIWGTWCPPCRAEIPSFIKLQDKFGKHGFQMIGLNFEQKKSEKENLAAVVQFVEEMGINYPCMLGERKILDQVPGFGGFPTTLFVDKSGKVRLKAVGLHDYYYLEAAVSELLAE